MAGDPKNEETGENQEDAAPDVERETAKEVPIGIPVTAEEFARIKEEAAKPPPGDERARPDDDGERVRDKEEGNG